MRVSSSPSRMALHYFALPRPLASGSCVADLGITLAAAPTPESSILPAGQISPKLTSLSQAGDKGRLQASIPFHQLDVWVQFGKGLRVGRSPLRKALLDPPAQKLAPHHGYLSRASLSPLLPEK